MGATRLMNGPAGSSGRARRRTSVSSRARRSAGLLAVAGGGTLVLGILAAPAGGGPAATAALTVSGRTAGTTADTTTGACALGASGSSVKHVIYIQFDNVHYIRDNPNVPSDLEQMPHLLNFMEQNGTLLTNHHTPLIAHTATDILTSLTGVYGNDMGVPIANSFRYFNPNGTSNPGVSFAY